MSGAAQEPSAGGRVAKVSHLYSLGGLVGWVTIGELFPAFGNRVWVAFLIIKSITRRSLGGFARLIKFMLTLASSTGFSTVRWLPLRLAC